ncbi:MAG: hypothetical protein ACFCGT_14285 [Sandaracinaceae bacterium]
MAPRIRPRFSLPVQDVEAVRARILAGLRAEGCPFRGGAAGDYVELGLPEAEQHYWSPQLRLWFEIGDDGSAVLEGRFGPQPHVWTLYLALYAHLVFAAIAALMYGLSQMMLGRSPWALALVGVFALLIALVYLSAFYGQGLGSEEMFAMRTWLNEHLDDDEELVPEG